MDTILVVALVLLDVGGDVADRQRLVQHGGDLLVRGTRECRTDYLAS